MANVAMTWHNTSDEASHITVRLENLTYDASLYDDFQLQLHRWNGSAWELYDSKSFAPSVWAGSNYVYFEFIDNTPNHSYYAIGWAKYAGVWYDTYSSGPETIYTEIELATAYISSVSPHSFTLYRYASYGYLMVYLYDYTSLEADFNAALDGNKDSFYCLRDYFLNGIKAKRNLNLAEFFNEKIIEILRKFSQKPFLRKLNSAFDGLIYLM